VYLVTNPDALRTIATEFWSDELLRSGKQKSSILLTFAENLKQPGNAFSDWLERYEAWAPDEGEPVMPSLGGKYIVDKIKVATAATFVFDEKGRSSHLAAHASVGLKVVPVTKIPRVNQEPKYNLGAEMEYDDENLTLFPDTLIRGKLGGGLNGGRKVQEVHNVVVDFKPGTKLERRYHQTGSGSVFKARAGDGVVELYTVAKREDHEGESSVDTCYEVAVEHCKGVYDQKITNPYKDYKGVYDKSSRSWLVPDVQPAMFVLILAINPLLQDTYTRKWGAHFIGTFIEDEGRGDEQWASIVDWDRARDGKLKDASRIHRRLEFHGDDDPQWAAISPTAVEGSSTKRYLIENSDQLEVKRFVRPLYPSLERPTPLTLPPSTLNRAMRAAMRAGTGDETFEDSPTDPFRIWNADGLPEKWDLNLTDRWYQVADPADRRWYTPERMRVEGRQMICDITGRAAPIEFDLATVDRVRMRIVVRDLDKTNGGGWLNWRGDRAEDDDVVEDWFEWERSEWKRVCAYHQHDIPHFHTQEAADEVKRRMDEDEAKRGKWPEWFNPEPNSRPRLTPDCKWTTLVREFVQRGTAHWERRKQTVGYVERERPAEIDELMDQAHRCRSEAWEPIIHRFFDEPRRPYVEEGAAMAIVGYKDPTPFCG